MKRIAFCALLAVALVRPASAQAPLANADVALRPGDAVRVTVWRKPELSGDFQVAADGTVKHPLYRDLHVAGLGIDSVRSAMQALLGRYEASPEFLVEPLFRVAVGGEVRKPDLYTLPTETTIAQALALAGGATDRGRLEKVKLVRGGRTEVLDLSRPESGAASRTIRSGDEILVGRGASVLREVVAPVASVVAAVGVLVNALR